MKKLFWILGGLFFAFLVAIISIPLFVDVDQYRPTIVAQANQRINGKLELGKLKLSLWGAIKVHADSIKLTVNGFPTPMVDTQQFHLEIPFLSVLTGAPQVIAVLDSPKISIVKETNGKMNAMELMKVAPPAGAEASPAPKAEQTAAADSISAVSAAANKKPAPHAAAASGAAVKPPPAAPTENRVAVAPVAPVAPAAPAAAPAGAPKVPAIVAGARLGLRINNGDLAYTDKVSKSNYQVIGLDVNAKNLGLGSTMNITVKAPVKGASPTMTFEGPITADVELKPTLVNNSVKSVSGKVDFDATKLAVEMKGGLFHKTDSMPLTMHAQFDGSETETLLRALDVQFTDFKLHGKGRVTMEPMAAKIDITTDPGTVKLDKVQSFVPMAAAYDLKGGVDFNADIDWAPTALHANGDLKVNDGGFFMKDMLKAPMGFKLQAGFSENSLNVTRASLTGPESDVELDGNVKNFLAPQFSFAIRGKSFNVDKTLVLPAPGAAPAKSAMAFPFAPYAYAEVADVNPMLAMAKNPMILGAAGVITAQIGKIIVYGASLDQVSAHVQLQNLMLKIQEASLKTFGGSVKTSGEFDLKSPGLTYHSQGNVENISAKEALGTYFPKYKNTLEGTVASNWNMSGTAYPAATRIRNVKGTAKLTAKDGTVKSVDFQDSISSATAKIPFLKGQKVQVDNGFKSLSADVKIEGGVIKIEPVEIYPRNQGLVIKGKSTILENLDQDTYLDVYDPQNQLPRELHGAAGKPVIPLHITGQLSSPHTDYGYTLQRVASTAGTNVAKDQVMKALGVQSAPGDSDQDKLKKAADALKKKFHF
ncbi:MAG: AsmA family protein [Bdellovibrionota bacterium]